MDEPGAAHGVRAGRRLPRLPATPASRVALARTVLRTAVALPRWGLLGGFAFLAAGLIGSVGAVTGWLWGRFVAGLAAGADPCPETVGLVACLLLAPVFIATGLRTYPMGWTAVSLRARLAELRGQTMQHRLPRIVPGDVVAKALDSDRLVFYVDRWVWDLATALLVTVAVSGSSWYASQCGSAVTEAPVARRCLQAAADLSRGADPVSLPPGVDLLAGTAPPPPTTDRSRCTGSRCGGSRPCTTTAPSASPGGPGRRRRLAGAARRARRLGEVEPGRARRPRGRGRLERPRDPRSPAGAAAGPGRLRRPGAAGAVRHVHRQHRAGPPARAVGLPAAVADSRMQADVDDAGGLDTLVGHRGVLLSGGQVQRLALARALATGAELLIADDVSSALDARTEVELWEALRRRGVTVVGCSSKAAALTRADRVVVLEDGRVAAVGPWERLAGDWGHLAG